MGELRLFLADDMPAVREVIRSCLADRYEVVGEAADGLVALTEIVALGPDVVILDVDMPGMSGFEVVEALRNLGFAQPVILCSSWDGAGRQSLPQGVTRCLRKPFCFRSLTEAVEEAALIRYPD